MTACQREANWQNKAAAGKLNKIPRKKRFLISGQKKGQTGSPKVWFELDSFLLWKPNIII